MNAAARGRARPVDAGRSGSAGFTLLELTVVLGLMAMLVAFVMPRLGVLTSAALDTSARRLATRVQFLREEAALRNHWIRLAVDPAKGSYRAERLVVTTSGARFAPIDAPLYRETIVPSPIGLTLEGPGVSTTTQGYKTTLFSPDGYADPATIWLDDGAGRRLVVLIDPVATRARVLVDDDVPQESLRGRW